MENNLNDKVILDWFRMNKITIQTLLGSKNYFNRLFQWFCTFYKSKTIDDNLGTMSIGKLFSGKFLYKGSLFDKNSLCIQLNDIGITQIVELSKTISTELKLDTFLVKDWKSENIFTLTQINDGFQI